MRNTYTHKQVWMARQVALAAIVAMSGVRADVEDPIVAGYRTRQEDLVQKSNVLLASADQSGRELNADERTQIRDNTAEVERLEEQIALRASVAAQDQRLREPQPRRTAAAAAEPLDESQQRQSPQSGPVIQTTHLSTAATRAAARGNGGFHNLGSWAQAVRSATVQPQNMDGRLRAALGTTYGNESTGADGGFAVPIDFRENIVKLAFQAEESLFSKSDQTPTSGNSVTVVTDETTAYSTSGVRVYTRAEAAAMTASKPSLKDITVRLHELYAFVPMTDELLEDAPMLSTYLSDKAGDAFQFKLNDLIVNGTGAGQMLGIMKSPCLVTVSKESSQTADTLHANNIVKMWARMPGSVRNRAVWLINQDLEPQLMQLGSVVKTPDGTATGGIPAYLPPGGLSASPYGTLLGRPVILTEACAAIGDLGDIVLAYMGGYFAPFKGTVKSDVSMHLYFDQAVTAFRWTLRVGGQPWLSSAIARKNGSNTLSHFVTLEAR